MTFHQPFLSLSQHHHCSACPTSQRGSALLPITPRVACTAPTRWHLPHWDYGMIGRSSLWPTRWYEDVLTAFFNIWGTAVRIIYILLASTDSPILAKCPNSIRRLYCIIEVRGDWTPNSVKAMSKQRKYEWNETSWLEMSRGCRRRWRTDRRRVIRRVDQQRLKPHHTRQTHDQSTPSLSPATTRPSPTWAQ